MKKIVAIVQARTSSTRLPNKVLEKLGETCLLVEQVKRMQRSKLLCDIVIATSSDSSDDIIEDLCVENGFLYYRGSLTDVLSRYYYAAKKFEAKIVVRVTGDCPFSDPELIDNIIDYHLENKSSYTSNCRPATFPDGLDVEVFNFNLLEEAFLKAELPSEREHVSPYIVKNTTLLNYENSEDLSGLRVTVDNIEDLLVVRKVFSELGKKNILFGYKDVISYLVNHPEVSSINSKYIRNEGSIKSKKMDEEFLSGKGRNE